ncbi:MAG: YhbY family RNA-binding protein [Thermofilaceae archaeon]
MSGKEIVVVRVGKRGVTDELIAEIDNVLRSKGIVKVKLLKNFREAFEVDREVKEELVNALAKKLNATIVELRGYTFVLKRPRQRSRRTRGF